MFRAQQNAYDDVVAKATDENLTVANWEYIIEVCDKVSAEDSGPKDAVASMIKRLAHRNANVQLYTLELANSLSLNCGPKVHRELASRAFTDALLRLANDRNTHQQVKAKILERMAEWAEEFKDPDLGIMRDQYQRLKSQNPNLHPPSAPSKSRLTDVDRQREEEELQMALKLSIQDKTAPKDSPQTTAPGSSSQAQGPIQQSTVPSGTTAATVSRVRALFEFEAKDPDELSFRKGDIITVLESVYKDWWKGFLRGHTGIFPLNYVEKLADPTQEELQRDAEMEAEVFGEFKNVEKLLALLSTTSSDLNVRDNEEITKLYHSTLAVRPKLIELIGKYSQKKDDLTQLNERFVKSSRDYDNMLDASMTQPQPSYQYGRQPQGYGGGYPPQAAPPQQDPQRYYTPHPQEQGAYPPQSVSPQNYPPQPGNAAPFHVVGYPQQNHPSEPQGHQPYPQQAPTSRIPSGTKPLQTSSPPPQQYAPPQAQGGHRPQSTYSNPQELATSVYDSPVNQQQHPNAPYSASVYSQQSEDPYSANPNTSQPPPGQQHYNAYPGAAPQSQAPPQSQPPPVPTGQAPPIPSGTPGYPNITNPYDARQTLPSQSTPVSSQYKPYQRPASPGASAPLAPSAPPGGPADFYRQSAAY